MAIFSHKYGMEPNVDHLEVLAPEGRNILRFLQQSPGDVGDVSTECTLDREAVERLYSTLGEWLYPTGVKPVVDLTALGEALSKGLAEMATAVQSLHLSPVAVVKVPEAPQLQCQMCSVGDHPHVFEPCVRPRCQCSDTVPWTTPQAAGPSARELEPLCSRVCPSGAHAASRCTWCGHLWAEHAGSTTRTRCGQCDTYNDTPIPHVCEPEPEHHGRLMSELPRRVRKCIGCAHAVIDHVPPARNWDGGCLECPCDWMGPTR